MTRQEQIYLAVQRLVETAKPSKVILFGSQAVGEETGDSDLDFLVIQPHVDSKVDEMARLRNAIGFIGVPVDVIVYSEKEVGEWGHLRGTVLYWALKDGKVLYEAPN